eukprot:1147462-Pelagomonas_calceolata.AAC.2
MLCMRLPDESIQRCGSLKQLVDWEIFLKFASKEEVKKNFSVCLKSARTDSNGTDSILQLDCSALFKEFADVEAGPSLPEPCNVGHAIEFKQGTKPKMGPIYRLLPNELHELPKRLQELLKKGLIGPSRPPYSDLVLIDDLLDQLHGAKVFSSLDLRSSYQIGIEAGVKIETSLQPERSQQKPPPPMHTESASPVAQSYLLRWSYLQGSPFLVLCTRRSAAGERSRHNGTRTTSVLRGPRSSPQSKKIMPNKLQLVV